MQKISFIFTLIIGSLTLINGQSLIKIDRNFKPDHNDGVIVQPIIENGDTSLYIPIKSVNYIPPFQFSSKKELRRYTRLALYVKKVYPYSQIVCEQVNEIHEHLSEYETKKEKNQYIKEKEDELKKEFEGELRKLTFSQGKILIKLIDRETGSTTFELVKELKGSLNAFFWQSVARIFGSNLKLEYDAEGEDAIIEDIVKRIENGEL